jgi:co-chaperonin GroES (HSP10)
MNNYLALNDFIIVKMIEEEKKGILFLPANESEYPRFQVVNVGPGSDKYLPPVQQGDIIYLANKYTAQKIKIEDEIFFIVRFADIVLKAKKTLPDLF